MNRCSSSSHGNMVGEPCTCGVFHSQSNSFSMLFPKDFDEQEADMYSFTSSSSSSSSSSVDCTLSLGTPSTRSCESAEKRVHHHDRLIPSFCWDILQSKKHTASSPPTRNKASRGSCGGDDSLLARRCANCDTTSTPLWRNGPRGPKSLCNACGIRFKKEERRATATATATATAAAAAATTTTASGGAESAIMDSHQRMLNNSSWDQHHHQQSQKMPCFSPAIGNEFRFINADNDRDIDTSIPFLSWHRNITDRPSLVHGFTR